ncbi:MAG: hypothetical protein JW993_13280 [Sedimentisphaerales bacterium]|nr:hypothetical protein [Sedimentisphaerales bacterium]
MAKAKRQRGRRPARRTGRAPSPPQAARRYGLKVAVAVVLAGASVGAVALLSRRPSSEPAQQAQTPAPAPNNEGSLPGPEPLNTAEQMARLQEEELALGAKLLADFPDSDEALAIVANMYFRRGQVLEAQELRSKALRINPRRADVYAGLA